MRLLSLRRRGHHLDPAVPHASWAELARRLDPHLARLGVRPVRLWF